MTASSLRTFVIAEAAGCHDGDFRKALRLVDVAADVDADAVKFQWVSSPERLAARRRASEYLAAYHILAFSPSWHEDLAWRCAAAGIEYMCTVYLQEDIAVIAPHVQRFKVSSFEAEDVDFVATHFAYWPKPILVSTGMQGETLGRLFGRVAARQRAPVADVRYLHCVSAYPAPLEELCLAVIRRHGLHGLSDHTRHPWTGALAVAAGAEIIEFHVRLDDTLPTNADYQVSRSPAEAREYVANVRLAERMLGDGVKRVMPCEEPMLRYRVTPS